MGRASRVIIVSLSFITFLLWNVFTPVFEAVDEPGYYQHVSFLAKEHRLPDLNNPPQDGGVMSYPPTAYLPMIPIAMWFNPPSIGDSRSLQMLPNHRAGFRSDHFNWFIHPKAEANFQWDTQALSVHLMRFVSSVWGVLTIWLIYKTGQLLFKKEGLALLSSAIVAFNPMFAHLHSTIIVLPPLIFLSSLTFYLLLKWAKTIYPGQFFSLGLLVGLATITKATGMLLAPIVLVGYWYLSQPKLKNFVRNILIFTLGFLTVSGWYFVRNFKLYGSLLGIEAVVATTGSRAFMQELMGPVNYWVGFFTSQFATFFSGYGWVAVYLPRVVYWFLTVLVILAGVGVLRGLRRFASNKVIVFFLASFAYFLMMLAMAHVRFPTFHAKDLYPMIVPISISLVFGWQFVFQNLNQWLEGRPIKITVFLFLLSTMYLVASVSPKLFGLQPLF